MKKTINYHYVNSSWIFVSFFFIWQLNSSLAQTIILGGPVSGTWTADYSPYIIQANIYVDGSLVIKPGVEVQFGAGVRFTHSRGNNFSAIGKIDSMILFTSNEMNPSPGDWNGILVDQTSTAMIRFCIIEYATTGIHFYARVDGCNDYDNRSEISYSEIKLCSFNAIRCTAEGTSSGCTIRQTANCDPIIEYCKIFNNQGLAINMISTEGFRSNSSVAPFVRYCIIWQNGGGLNCSGDDSCRPVIENNNIINNNGYGVSFGSNSPTSLTIINNIISKNDIGIESRDNVQPTYDYNNIWSNNTNYFNLIPAQNDISSDPLFQDEASGDFSLKENSPCIDTGDPNSPQDPDGTIADIGAIYSHCQVGATLITNNITCFDGNDGIISLIDAFGGSGYYEYSINSGVDWESNASFVGLPIGIYDVQIRDSLFPTCRMILDAALILTEPAVITAQVFYTDITCNGATDGSITMSDASGGTGSFEYTIDGGNNWQSSAAFGALSANTYNVQIRDANAPSCITVLDAALILTEPAVITAQVFYTDITCNGVTDGSITISGASGGTGSFEYTIDGGNNWQSSEIFNSLGHDFYNVQIRDAELNTCSVILESSLPISEPQLLTAQVIYTNISCPGAADGSITITAASGGSGSYEFSANGGISWQSSETFNSLTTGSYHLQVRDANSTACFYIVDDNISISEPDQVMITVIIIQPDCQTTGSIEISVPDAGVFEYSVDNGVKWLHSNNFPNLNSGAYNIMVRPQTNQSCTTFYDQNPVILTTPTPPNISLVAVTQPTCQTAGGIVVNATGGGTLEYSADNGVNWQTSSTFNNLTDGNYIIVVRLQVSTTCSTSYAQNPVTLTTPFPPNISLIDVTQPTCQTAGGIVVIATGDGTLEYSADNGVNWQTSNLYDNVTNGTHHIIVRLQENPTCNTAYYQNPVVLSQPMDMLAVDETPIPSGTYGALTQITSMGSIAGGSIVLFATGENVELLPNFTVEVAGVFEIQIQPCNP